MFSVNILPKIHNKREKVMKTKSKMGKQESAKRRQTNIQQRRQSRN